MAYRQATRNRLARASALVGLLALALPGQASAQAPSAGPDGPGSAAPSGPPTILVACGYRAYPGLGIDGPPVDPRGEDALSTALADALERYRDDFPVSEDAGWRLAGLDETGYLFLGRNEGTPEAGWVAVEAEQRDGRWRSSIGDCDPRRVIAADIGRADWWPDPAFPAPGPEDTELHVLVVERACASGQPPDGRIAAPVVEYSIDAVMVMVGVRRIDGDATCPSNPASPLAVALSEPLGERLLIDGSRLPPGPPVAPEHMDGGE